LSSTKAFVESGSERGGASSRSSINKCSRKLPGFSIGSNDLTQLTFGFSRDDAGKFLPEYVERKILPQEPFVSLDIEGVGALIEWSVERGRKGRPGLKVGICGEHGGDPASVHFCHRAGLDYVSCSPYRVPIARLAAAQAALQGKTAGSDQR
jgi:pyruvate,orthophosphate dikinase